MTSKINYTIEELYEKIKPEINLVSSYLEDSRYKKLITACRLKPYNYNSMFGRNLKLHKHWVDEFNNSVFFDKKNKIIFNDLSINYELIKSTDLYYGLPFEKILKVSKHMYMMSGKDEDLGLPFAFVTLTGIDGFYRSYVKLYGEMHQISTLLLGFQKIFKIIDNQDVKHYIDVKDKSKDFPFVKDRQEWISSVPLSQKFVEISKYKTIIGEN